MCVCVSGGGEYIFMDVFVCVCVNYWAYIYILYILNISISVGVFVRVWCALGRQQFLRLSGFTVQHCQRTVCGSGELEGSFHATTATTSTVAAAPAVIAADTPARVSGPI